MELSTSSKNFSTGVDITSLFTTFKNSLDEHYARRERIIKCSRDITIQSKNLITFAQRITPKTLNSSIEKSATTKQEILKLFKDISVELQGVNYYSDSLQEYIEAMSLLEYLHNRKLLDKIKDVDNDFKDENGTQFLQVTNEDYLLGVADLSGELMRYATNCIGRGDHDFASIIGRFLRDLKSDYEIIAHNKYFVRKLEVMKQNLNKVEDVCYAIKIRGSEYPKEFYQHIVAEHTKRFEETD
nr:9085_t:CDS:2 [Entrophospora candida]